MASPPSCWGCFSPSCSNKQKEDLADAAEQNEENVPSDPRRQPFCYLVLGSSGCWLWSCVHWLAQGTPWILQDMLEILEIEVPWKTFQW